ncbi:alpha-L-fucosidase [Olivibacter sp. SDN3]|uniref:alpha-L-fucosidase n=1 Tax=Olivibacter sp. SDN3 TaxID=2764720 RepID=UPI0016513C15|nr:alpha-L-fucosidase [Olivibacter sp. SDN3]QNL50190.1 alpha-L-fucosidase [Olivibacter sp. SDN3]
MNFKNYIISFVIILCYYSQLNAQSYVLIEQDDLPAKIIEKAANIIPTERQLRWQELEVTGFFHFGINTFTDREWGDGKEDPSLFNPEALDAVQWVKAAKDGGIKQVIITAKHHDGFCLWPSKYTKHSVASSPWKQGKGDIVREVANACRKLGVGFGIYLSPWDRHESTYGTVAYNDFFVNQLTELLTQYGVVDEVWFDGANGEGPNGKKQVYDFERWYALIRKLQPRAVIAVMGPDVRWVGTETGYGRETEWSVVPADNLDQSAVSDNSQQDLAFKPSGDMRGDDLGGREKIYKAKGLVWYPAETDVSIRPGWFYHTKEDDQVKTPEKLLDIYFNSVGKNGVLLLNIPPDKRGRIHESDVQYLREWKKNIDNIFETNLLEKAEISAANVTGLPRLVDNNKETYWTPTDTDSETELLFTLDEAITFNVLSVQEFIKKGQRIEQFVLEYKEGDSWKEVARGTTVGYKRLLKFDTVRADNIRLRITSSRLNPMISHIGLYKQ